MARDNSTWRAIATTMFTQNHNIKCTKYTMEAWCKENPELCAHIILFCYDDDDINAIDIRDMKKALLNLFRSKAIDGACLNYKLYDQRGIQLQVR